MIKTPIRELKTKARILLDGKYGFFVLITFILMTAQYALNAVIDYAFPISAANGSSLLYFSCSLLSNILYIILFAGACRIYLNRIRGIESQQYDLFFGFVNQPEHLALYAAIRFLLSFALSETWNRCSGQLFSGKMDFSFFMALLILLLISVIVLYLYLTFSLSIFLYCDHPEKPAAQLLRESNELMHGNRGRLLYLKLSFIGISLLGVLSFGIGLLFIEPYFNLTQALFYESLNTSENDTFGK